MSNKFKTENETLIVKIEAGEWTFRKHLIPNEPKGLSRLQPFQIIPLKEEEKLIPKLTLHRICGFWITTNLY